MANINNVCDYIIMMCKSGGEQLNLLKLQKLLYYVQAWSLAFTGKPFFNGKFQAWVHGPVNREIYQRFSGTKTLYSTVDESDMQPDFNPETSLSAEDRLHIDNVLEVYASYSGSELEAEAHGEEPWIKARGNCRPSERCESELDEELMKKFYASRLAN
jgi:uncharacterized phage-associated protein